MKYWRIPYFKQYFEMTDEEFDTIKSQGRIAIFMIQGKPLIDIDTIYLPRKFHPKVEQLRNMK